MHKIDVSLKTLLTPFVVVGVIWLFTQIWDILLLLFVAFLLMTALRPLVTFVEKLRVPRMAATVLVYLFMLFLVVFLVAETVPQLAAQTSKFIEILPSLLNKALPVTSGFGLDLQSLTGQVAPFGQGVVRVTVGLFSNLLSFVGLIVCSFYFLLERAKVHHYFEMFMGEQVGQRAYKTLLLVEERLGAWVRGQFFLMLFVFCADYLGLVLLKVEFALPLAIIAALFELIPIVGPITAGAMAVLVALSINPIMGLFVAALYFIVQQVQAAVVIPFVMSKSVGVSPLTTIIALLLGSRFLGVGAAILTIPMFLVIEVIIKTAISLRAEALADTTDSYKDSKR